jgi:arsenite-transporting ATPase
MVSIPEFLTTAPRHVFFTGKGGVGKTSLACPSAVVMADNRLLIDDATRVGEVTGEKAG